jgi:hypothetical protein
VATSIHFIREEVKTGLITLFGKDPCSILTLTYAKPEARNQLNGQMLRKIPIVFRYDHPQRAQQGCPAMIGMKEINKPAQSVEGYERALEN